MITADQLVCHAVGDYLCQSHWMAQEKTKRWLPAVAHALTYLVPFLLLTRSLKALVAIGGTHLLIDRYRLARHVTFVKNVILAPEGQPAQAYNRATGYPDDAPPWLAVWLLIIADNILHVCINGVALKWL